MTDDRLAEIKRYMPPDNIDWVYLVAELYRQRDELIAEVERLRQIDTERCCVCDELMRPYHGLCK